MHIFLLTVANPEDEQDLDDALTPSLPFLSLEGAKAFAQKDVDQIRAEWAADGFELTTPAELFWPECFTADGWMQAHDMDTGNVYRIAVMVPQP